MGLWQSSMIALARSERTKRTMQHVAGRTMLARRFAVIGDGGAAIATARRLHDTLGITASLCHLGEYVDDAAAIERTVEASIDVAGLLGPAGLEVHVSVDPTAIGHLRGGEVSQGNAERIARAVAAAAGEAGGRLMLDMEDLTLVDPTLRLLRSLLALGLPAAITLQARLRRTEADLRDLVRQRTAVRLVKGAFPLGPEHDHQGRAAITAEYLILAGMMLDPQARDAGFRPIFATHDDSIVRRVAVLAQRNGWRKDEYEFEFLFGVRPDWQQRLRARDHSVRVYLPFGTEWWPYAVRRIGENPRNALLLGRALLGRRYQRV
jgi:proline dehydrogenase